MRLHSQSATIGLCLDLTNPQAPSLPVAVLVVGEAGADRFAAVAGLVPRAGHLDLLTRDALADAPFLIRDHVDRTLNALAPDAPIEQILTSLHQTLRNSLHVASIDPAEETEIEGDAEALADHLLRAAAERLKVALSPRSASPRPARSAPPEWADVGQDLAQGMPSRTVWPIAREQRAMA